MNIRKHYENWLRRGIIGVWAELFRLPDDLAEQLAAHDESDPETTGRRMDRMVPVWTFSLLDLVVQLALLGISIGIVHRTMDGDTTEWGSVAISMWAALQQWPWIWLVVMAATLTALVHHRVFGVDRGTGGMPDSRLSNSSGFATGLLYLGASALQSILARVGANLSLAVVIVGVPTLLLANNVGDRLTGAGVAFAIPFGGVVVGVLLIWVLLRHPTDTMRPAAQFAVRILIAGAAWSFASWHPIVGLMGAAFVFSRLYPLWFLPALFGAIVVGFTGMVDNAMDGATYPPVKWLTSQLEIGNSMQIATLGFVLVASVGRFLSLVSRKLEAGLELKYVLGTLFSVLLLGTPLVLGVGELQGWIIQRFSDDWDNLGPPEMLALMTIVVGIPTVFATLPLCLYQLFRIGGIWGGEGTEKRLN